MRTEHEVREPLMKFDTCTTGGKVVMVIVLLWACYSGLVFSGWLQP